jgi:hypothetical protein
MPSAAPLNAAIVRSVLTMRCTVWARTANTGPYNSAVKTGLACRLDTVNVQPARTGTERADLAALRVFMWDTTYAMPASGVQIEVTSPAHYAGQRWNIQAGTQKPAIPPGFDGPIAIEADVRRAS